MDPADLQEARRLMQLEYETAQASIANFDEQRAKIKAWTITAVGAVLVLAVNSHSVWLGAIATAAVFFFAYIDIMYMAIQQRVIDRSNNLEDYIEAARRGNFAITDSYIFGMGRVFHRKHSWRQVPGMLRRRPQIVGFYVGLAIGTGVATALMP